jgi:hypothetical protein
MDPYPFLAIMLGLGVLAFAAGMWALRGVPRRGPRSDAEREAKSTRVAPR